MTVVRRTAFFFLIFLSALPFLFAGSEDRTPWVLDETYNGSHPSAFQELKWKIPALVRQTQINMAVRLGLRFEEGWRYPLAVRFRDKSPVGTENVLAYVELTDQDGVVSQSLVINVGAYTRTSFDFERVFAHELVHAMINDALGAKSALIFPVWLNEGLAVYGADQGEQVMLSYVHRMWGFAEGRLINGLDGPHTAYDYVEDYLAIKYINDTHGVNALHNFVRKLVDLRGNVREAYESATNESWDKFLKKARQFAVAQIRSVEPPQRGKIEDPY